MAHLMPSTIVLRVSAMIGLLIILFFCCLVFSVAFMDEDSISKLEPRRQFQTKQIAKRQAESLPETSTSDLALTYADDTAAATAVPSPKGKATGRPTLLSTASEPPDSATATAEAVLQNPMVHTQVGTGGGRENMTLEIEPKNVFVHEGEMTNITITYANLRTPLFIKLKVVDDFIYNLASNDTFHLMPAPKGQNTTKVITIKGKNVGITGLAIIVIEPRKPPPTAPTFIQIIRVLRVPRNVDKIFDYSLMPLVIVVTTGMGCKMQWTTMRAQLRRPFPIAVGPLCQFILMPFLAFAVGKMVQVDVLTAIGLLTSGSCPGGGLSNMITLLVQADLIQSAVMTVISTILGIGMLPLNLWIYARAFTHKDGSGYQGISLPLGRMVAQVVMLSVPLIMGIVIRHRWPKISYYLLRHLNALSAFLLTASVAIGLYSNVYVIKSPRELLLSAVLLPVFGFVAGFLVARFIARLKPCKALTVSIETGVQNNLVAISMIKLSFPQPEADLMARGPIFVGITAVFIGLGMILASIPINRRLKKKRKAAAECGKGDEQNNVESPETRDPGYDFRPLPSAADDDKTDNHDELPKSPDSEDDFKHVNCSD